MTAATQFPCDPCQDDAGAGSFGFRTACWLKALHPTAAVRSGFSLLPPTRVVRHGDYVHVLYDVDGWSRAGTITREDVVARVRSALFAVDIAHELAIGHFVCETGTAAHDGDELLRAMRTS